MFKQAKKARELMDDTQYRHDEFNWFQIILIVIFSISIVGIWYYSRKANEAVEKKTNTNNPIIQDLQGLDKINSAIEKFGDLHEEEKEY